ncbi:hypothetical protein [Nitrosopumilus sp.]|uniref:hypothetical protein n=1 Tax=Nitrosopumilus sp. TaxID=2024843 RepID=UPI00349FD569
MFEFDKFYRDCKQQNKPFIKAKINPVHKNYFVQVDLMTCDYNLSKKTQDEIDKLIHTEIDYVNFNSKYAFEGYNIDKEIAWFDGVSIEHIDDFCNALYDVIEKLH